jgi:WD40 repeat protein
MITTADIMRLGFVSNVSIDIQILTSYFVRMTRTRFVLSMSICLLLPGSLLAQRSFPSPVIKLHDVKFKPADPSRHGAVKLGILNGQMSKIPPTLTQINSLAFSHDGNLLAAGKEYGRLVVWDVASQQIVCIVDTGFASVGQVAISPDNQLIAAAAESGPGIKLWHIPDGQLAATLENTHANVLRLLYTQNPNLLIVFSGPTDVFDSASGKLVVSFAGERDPVLSIDGSTLLTLKGSQIVLRNTREWAVERTLPKLTESERPVFLDTTQGLFLFEDFTDAHLFVAARTSDGQMLPDEKLSNLPKSWLDFYDFAAIDPQTGIVFGHSSGQLWALDLKSGKTCLSQQLNNVNGALSPDGRLVAGAFEPSTPNDDQKEAGVNIWKTDVLASACHMQ